MKRRDFIRVIVGSAAAWPLAARAQQHDRMRRLGLLMTLPENDAEEQRRVAAFVKALRELGWIEGSNIQIDYRWPGANGDRIHGAAVRVLRAQPSSRLMRTSAAGGS
jgi:putative tryptophan/tyrosine transport system substrate-binding protein